MSDLAIAPLQGDLTGCRLDTLDADTHDSVQERCRSFSCTRQGMRVTVLKQNNKTLIVRCSEDDAVIDLKRKIWDKDDGCSVDLYRLVFGVKTLRDTDRLRDSGIQDGSIVHLIFRGVGGAFLSAVAFDFASLESGRNRLFGKNAPNYRRIASGFNLEGRCTNVECQAYGQLAWSNLGFSRSPQDIVFLFETAGFNIGSLLHKTPCPLCKDMLDPESIVSCGFFRCRYSYEGFQKGKKSAIRGSGKASGRDGFEYHDGMMESRTWTSLIIAVERI